MDLSRSAALRGVHDVFHVSLLHGWLTNGIHANVPPIEIDGKAEYEVSKIKGLKGTDLRGSIGKQLQH